MPTVVLLEYVTGTVVLRPGPVTVAVQGSIAEPVYVNVPGAQLIVVVVEAAVISNVSVSLLEE